jgi:hypothetical protein
MGMRQKIFAWIVWAAAGLAILATLNNLVNTVINRDPSSSPIKLASQLLWMAFPIAFAVPAALIVSRHLRNIVGWLLMLPALSLPGMSMLIPGTRFLIFPASGPPSPPSIFLFLAIWFDNWSWILLIFPILLIPLFFPTGRLLSPRWRWIIVIAALQILYIIFTITFAQKIKPLNAAVEWEITNPIGFISYDSFSNLIFSTVWTAILSLVTIVSLSSVIVRFRRGSVVERAQIKWFLYACALFATIYVASGFRSDSGQLFFVLDLLLILSIMAIPLSIAIAILRHRLFDIDVIIRKTLVYAVLSGLTGLLFVGSILILQSIFNFLLGEQSQAAIVLSTLLSAVLFTPLRIRVQSLIDQRFFRQKYDAEKLMEAFARRTRDETDLEGLSGYLLEVVNETLQPVQMSLWIKSRQ